MPVDRPRHFECPEIQPANPHLSLHQKEDYFFGSVDANRVQLSTGRDIALSPKQDGPALNYFVYPYVEVDGKPYDKQFSFEEVKSSQ
jgi:hypothetical protein